MSLQQKVDVLSDQHAVTAESLSGLWQLVNGVRDELQRLREEIFGKPPEMAEAAFAPAEPTPTTLPKLSDEDVERVSAALSRHLGDVIFGPKAKVVSWGDDNLALATAPLRPATRKPRSKPTGNIGVSKAPVKRARRKKT